jgi:hypothetical protein
MKLQKLSLYRLVEALINMLGGYVMRPTFSSFGLGITKDWVD